MPIVDEPKQRRASARGPAPQQTGGTLAGKDQYVAMPNADLEVVLGHLS
jgi:hypothetical protein